MELSRGGFVSELKTIWIALVGISHKSGDAYYMHKYTYCLHLRTL